MIKYLAFMLLFVGGFAFSQGDTDRELTDAAPQGFQSVYTPIDFDNCFTLDSSGWYENTPVGYFAQECPALLGYQVFIDAGDLRSWLILERAEERFVFRDDVRRALGGNFPYISGSLLEWRFLWSDDLTPQPVALIYRMSRQNPETLQDSSALVVLRMNGEVPCLLGVAESNVLARALADDLTRTCSAQ